jgi:hypothetical protein
MIFAFKASRLWHKVERWREHKPILQRKLWAVRGILNTTTFANYRLQWLSY